MLSWGLLLTVVHGIIAPATAWHALLYKRDSRAAFGWIGLCLLFPLVGPVLYYLLGVNRVEHRARKMRGVPRARRFVEFERGGQRGATSGHSGADSSTHLAGLMRAAQTITGRPLVAGNLIEPLYNGQQAYPAMLAAIEQAQRSVCLMTYIFDTDGSGTQFVDALAGAAARGVAVHVMVDGMGEKYAWPRVSSLLARRDITCVRFNPPTLIPPTLNVNLRNHRKILIVDGIVAFTGGMNIGDRHLVESPGSVRGTGVRDIHFQLRGPIVEQLIEVFGDSWQYATGRKLDMPMATHLPVGSGQCRVIADGPDENLDQLALVLQAAVTAARRRIRVMTPYFLPPRELIACLQSAALRGVSVEIVLPHNSNLRPVHWATRNMLWELLFYNVKVFYQQGIFSHSKLLLIDDSYALMGSANIDPRSLRLNYELGVEIYDPGFAQAMGRHFDELLSAARPVTLDEMDSRSLLVRTRDALCWLFSPYL